MSKNVSWNEDFIKSFKKKEDFAKWCKDNKHTDEECNEAWEKYGNKSAAPAVDEKK